MDSLIPSDWIPITSEQLEQVLSCSDFHYKRRGMANGIFYSGIYKPLDYEFAVEMDSGGILGCPEFFK